MTNEEIIKKFQCPGCSCGSDTKCGNFKLKENSYGDKKWFSCASHCPSTFMSGAGRILLGLPKGFNRPGRWLNEPGNWGEKYNLIRLWTKENPPEWDKFNVAVWALEEDGFLFVRTLSPRIGYTYIDVVEGGTLAMVPNAIDVSGFQKDMD